MRTAIVRRVSNVSTDFVPMTTISAARTATAQVRMSVFQAAANPKVPALETATAKRTRSAKRGNARNVLRKPAKPTGIAPTKAHASMRSVEILVHKITSAAAMNNAAEVCARRFQSPNASRRMIVRSTPISALTDAAHRPAIVLRTAKADRFAKTTSAS